MSGLQRLTSLLYNGPELNYAALAALVLVLAVSAALVALQSSQTKTATSAAATGDSPRKLRRKMSNIGISTLVSETETNLSIPVSLFTVAGKVSAEDFTARLQERFSTDAFFLRFRSLVVGAERTFVEVPNYDVSRNIRTHVLRDDETPVSYIETQVNKPLDFSKPLWEMILVLDPKDENVTHFGWKVHHCIGDGASLAVAMVRMSDNCEQFDAMIEKMQSAKKTERKSAKPLSAKAKDTLGFVLLSLWSAYVILRKLYVLVFRREPQTMFKRPGGTEKKLSYNMMYSVTATKAVGKNFGATVNDVMLNCVAGAMRKSMLEAGSTVAQSLTVRAAIPVDMRGSNEVVKSARNKFSALVIDFPVGVEDPIRRLRIIKGNMNEAKNSLEKFFTYTTSMVVSRLPNWLMAPVIRFTTSRVSVAISNVRGSSFQLSMCGKPLVGFFGFVPPPPTVNLGIAVLSVGDDLGLNVLVDRSVGLDAKKFLEYAKEEFDALEAAVKIAAAGTTKDDDGETKKTQ